MPAKAIASAIQVSPFVAMTLSFSKFRILKVDSRPQESYSEKPEELGLIGRKDMKAILIASSTASVLALVFAFLSSDAISRGESLVQDQVEKPAPKKSFYERNPVYRDTRRSPDGWKTSTPAKVGMTMASLKSAAEFLQSRPRARAFLVVRRDKLVYEKYFHGAAANESRNVHSVSKSILGALVGIAISEGKLSAETAKVADFLGARMPKAPDPRRSLRIDHLLTMTTGLFWKEDKTEYEIERKTDWVRAILNRPSQHVPGAHFNYSTGATHVLSAVLTEASGMPTHTFAAKRLLDPLKITVEHWGHPDPNGYDSGGCNLYLTPRELARFGLLALKKGKWKKRQLVPKAWFEKSLKTQKDVGGGYGYGYLWWTFRAKGHDVALAWGYGDQHVYVIPDLDIVVVVVSDTKTSPKEKELSPQSFAEKWIIPAVKPAK